VPQNAGVSVNKFPGFVEGDRFVALVPVDATVTALTVVARDFGGVLGTDSVRVKVQPPEGDGTATEARMWKVAPSPM
jgi:hypothetical protein